MGAEGFVRFQHKGVFPVRRFQTQGHRGHATAGSFIKIPHEAAESIPEPIAQYDAQGVFPLFQQAGQIVTVIVAHVIRIADIRGQGAFGHVFSVDVQLVKP